MKRLTSIQVSLIFCAAILGLIVAELAGEILQVRTGRAELGEYASKLEQTAIRVDQQTEYVMRAVSEDGLDFCSSQEISVMRSLVYDESEIKDVGRVKDQKFYCSSEIGNLPVAVAMPLPDAILGKFSIYAWTPIMIAPKTRGFMVQGGDVDVVLDPHAFDGLNDHARSYGIFLYDSHSGALFQSFGKAMQLSKAEILGGPACAAGGHLLPATLFAAK